MSTVEDTTKAAVAAEADKAVAAVQAGVVSNARKVALGLLALVGLAALVAAYELL